MAAAGERARTSYKQIRISRFTIFFLSSIFSPTLSKTFVQTERGPVGKRESRFLIIAAVVDNPRQMARCTPWEREACYNYDGVAADASLEGAIYIQAAHPREEQERKKMVRGQCPSVTREEGTKS